MPDVSLRCLVVLDGLRKTMACIDESMREGELEVARAQEQLVVQVLADGRCFLELAEALARRLAAVEPTRTNLELVAHVLEARGQTEEAAEYQTKAGATSPTEEESEVRRLLLARRGDSER